MRLHFLLRLPSEMEASKISQLWRKSNQESLAPRLVGHGIRSIDDIVCHLDVLTADGLQQWQLETIIATQAPQLEVEPVRERSDFPAPFQGKRASLAHALEAAAPNNRKKSLEALDFDMLSRSSNPSMESRVRTYQAICAAWEISPWPLSPTNIRCVAASFKMGGYRSAAVYFSAVTSYQLRHLRTEVDGISRRCIKDCVRSIRRGLGVTALKDAFDARLLVNISVVDDTIPFNFAEVGHLRDASLIAIWFMLREIEFSNAKLSHLTLIGDEVQLTLPLHKTDSYGRLTTRSLRCCCRIRRSTLCPWHAAERHLVRVSLHRHLRGGDQFPLFPTEEGRTPSKYLVINAFRKLISELGIPIDRIDPQGRSVARFGGHVMRVPGAQMLASGGIHIQLVQLLGRWSSQAIERYVQESHMTQVPNIPSEVLVGDDLQQGARGSRSSLDVVAPPRQIEAPEVVPSASEAAGPPPGAAIVAGPSQDDFDQLQLQVEAIRSTMNKPKEVYVARYRARVLHIGMMEELNNPPHTWRTKCGWCYGLSNFIRLAEVHPGSRQCKKCFGLGDQDSSDSDSESSCVECWTLTSALIYRHLPFDDDTPRGVPILSQQKSCAVSGMFSLSRLVSFSPFFPLFSLRICRVACDFSTVAYHIQSFLDTSLM